MKRKTCIGIAFLVVAFLFFSGSVFAAGNQARSGTQGPVEIEIFEGIGVMLPAPAQDPILQALQNKLGAVIHMNTTLGGTDYRNQLNIRIAGNDMPDVVWMLNRVDLVTNARDGTILDLTPYMGQLQPVRNYLGDYMAPGLVDGKYYAISKAPNIPYTSYTLRKDWLDALNLKMPETMEEFKQVALAFTNNDPNRTGQRDTIGLASSEGSWPAFQFIFGGYGIGLPNQIYVKNNTLINSLHEPDMPQVLNEVKAVIDSGSVDPELFTITDGRLVIEKAVQGRIGMMYSQWPNLSRNVGLAKEVNPNADWVVFASPRGPKDNLNSSHAYYSSGLLSFGAHLGNANNEAKRNKVFELFNYIASPEGMRLVSYGIQGQHYDVVNGRIVANERAISELGFLWAYQFIGRDEIEYLNTRFVGWDKEIQFANDLPRLRNLEAFMIPPDGYNRADMERYISDEMIKFIYGRRPITEYQRFLTELEDMFKLSVYMRTYEQQAREFGFLR